MGIKFFILLYNLTKICNMKNLIKLQLLLGLMLLSSITMAQKIKGTVTSAGNPLNGISVTASPSGKGMATDANGKYSLDLPAGTYKISFSGAGYQSKIETVSLSGSQEKTLDA